MYFKAIRVHRVTVHLHFGSDRGIPRAECIGGWSEPHWSGVAEAPHCNWPRVSVHPWYRLLPGLSEHPSVVELLRVEEQLVPIATTTVHQWKYRTNRDSLIPIHQLIRQLECPVRSGQDVKNIPYTAAGENGPTWSLWQKTPGETRGQPLGFWSRGYKGSEVRYTSAEKEILAAYKGVRAASEVVSTEAQLLLAPRLPVLG